MKKKFLLIFPLILTAHYLFAQKESWNWYFGDSAAINFSSGSPVALTNSAMTNLEGGASISDSNGNLLFYTDGTSVYNSSHNIMPNGSGLLGNPSSSQSALIVKKPSSNLLYYIFTIDFVWGTNGLRYSIVDMSLNGGKGDVTSKNILLRSRAKEKLTAVRHSNKKDFWILVLDWASDSICSYALTSSGVNINPVMSYADSLQMQDSLAAASRAMGYMKVNRQGNRIAMGLWAANSFDLFDFNNATGVASNHIKIQGNSTTMYKTYGVEFSPDGKKLYGTACGNNPTFKLYQFNLNAGTAQNIFNTRYTVAMTPIAANGGLYYYTALQIGPDGKIYCSLDSEPFLGVINYPDSLGSACAYVNNGVSLNGKHCYYGLPNFSADYVFPFSSATSEIEKQFGFKICPNPNKGQFFVELNSPVVTGARVAVYNVLGQCIFSEPLVTSGRQVLTLNQIPKGVYILRISSGKSQLQQKMVVD